jgi:hypothetical protein
MKPTEDLFIMPEIDSYDFRETFQNVADGYRRYKCLTAALETKLFDHLNDWKGADELEGCGFDRDVAVLVCDILTEMGYLECRGGRYRDTYGAGTYMVSTSPLYLGRTFVMIDDGLGNCDRIAEALKEGRGKCEPVPDRFYHSMTAFGDFSKGGFIRDLMDFIEDSDIPDGCSVLDVAGGHGLYSVALQSRFPNAKVYYFDRPDGARVARDSFDRYDIDIPILTGDYYAGEIPGKYDVLVSSFNDSACKPVLAEKLRNALNEGGMAILRRYSITVLDPLERTLQANVCRGKDAPFRRGPRGQTAEEHEEFESAMASCGFVRVRRQSLDNGTEMTVYRLG